jgi:hypothetical protein
VLSSGDDTDVGGESCGAAEACGIADGGHDLCSGEDSEAVDGGDEGGDRVGRDLAREILFDGADPVA